VVQQLMSVAHKNVMMNEQKDVAIQALKAQLHAKEQERRKLHSSVGTVQQQLQEARKRTISKEQVAKKAQEDADANRAELERVQKSLSSVQEELSKARAEVLAKDRQLQEVGRSLSAKSLALEGVMANPLHVAVATGGPLLLGNVPDEKLNELERRLTQWITGVFTEKLLRSHHSLHINVQSTADLHGSPHPQPQCCRCLSADQSVSVSPCGHVNVCSACAQSGQSCPLCPTHVHQRLPISNVLSGMV